jgi:hypothetical protein
VTFFKKNQGKYFALSINQEEDIQLLTEKTDDNHTTTNTIGSHPLFPQGRTHTRLKSNHGQVQTPLCQDLTLHQSQREST